MAQAFSKLFLTVYESNAQSYKSSAMEPSNIILDNAKAREKEGTAKLGIYRLVVTGIGSNLRIAQLKLVVESEVA